MKKNSLLFVLLFIVSVVFSQQKGIKITNIKTNKVVVIKEHKRVRVKTFDGEKISGKFTIIKKDVIKIKNKKIHFKDIEKIKRNPLLVSIFVKFVFIYTGAVILFFASISYAWSGLNFYNLLAIPGVAIIIYALKSPNFLKGYKNTKGWKYEIITLSD